MTATTPATTAAWIEIRPFPWRIRVRAVSASAVRETINNLSPTDAADDLAGMVILGLVWILALLAAPLIAILIAWGFFAFEVPILLIIGAGVLLLRLSGLIPWTVVVLDPQGEHRTRRRLLWRAISDVRQTNGGGRALVRWAWT